MAYENYVVKEFENAWFKSDRSVMNDDEFKIVYSEYLDTSGLFISEDFEKQGQIYNLNQRIEYVKMFIRLQRDFIERFKMPYVSSFKTMKSKYGHSLKWFEDIEGFKRQLTTIEHREMKNSSLLEKYIKELNESRVKKGVPEEDEDSLEESRKKFIRTCNSLGKVGYKLDKLVTTVEEFSLMIKQQLEEAEEIKKQPKR